MVDTRKLICVGMIRQNQNKVSKYVLLDINSKKQYILSIQECVDMLDSNISIIGLRKNNLRGVSRTGNFKYKAIAGEEAPEVYTVLKRICHRKYKEYELSDPLGQIKRVTEEELKDMLKQGIGINGLISRKSGIALIHNIDTVIER